MKLLSLFLLLAMSTAVAAETVPTRSAALPGDSLYLLDAAFTDQEGRSFSLADRRGRPQLVAMFYTSCRYVCPLIIDSAKGVEHALTADERNHLRILLVSMDPARDDTGALKRIFDRRKLDAASWTFARTDAQHVRSLAALLGVRYRALTDGEFNHTSALILLDRDGRRVASTTSLGTKPDPEFMAILRTTLAADRVAKSDQPSAATKRQQ